MNSSLLNHLHPQQPNTPQQLSFQSQFQRPSINSTLPNHLYSQQPNAPQHSYFQPQSQQPSTNSSLPNHLHQQQSNTPPPPAYPFPTLNSSLQSVSQSPSNWHSGLSPNCYELVCQRKSRSVMGVGKNLQRSIELHPQILLSSIWTGGSPEKMPRQDKLYIAETLQTLTIIPASLTLKEKTHFLLVKCSHQTKLICL